MKHPIRNSLLVLLTLAILFVVSACGYRFYNSSLEEKAEYFSEKISKELDLNAVQKEKLSLLKKKIIVIAEKMQQAKEQNHEQLLSIIANEKFDQVTANRLLTEKSQNIALQGTPLITVVADFYDSLDNKQQQKIRAEVTEHSKNSCRTFSHK